MAELRNILIIGAASGATLARVLEKSLPSTHRIVLIEANESAYWPIAAVRGAVKPGYEEHLFARLDTFFPSGSRHIMLNKTRVVSLSEKSVTVDRQIEPFDSTEIPIEYCVLATGSSYCSPCRPSSTSTGEAKAALRQQQIDIERASSILLIGGGPVTVELAGEILHLYPEKRVTLAVRRNVLLSGRWTPSFPAKLERQLKKRGAVILYSTTVDVPVHQLNTLLPATREFPAIGARAFVSADYIIAATGGRPNTELVPDAALFDGRISVDSTLRLTYAPLTERYFSIGDASSAPGDRSFFTGYLQSFVVADHIKGAIKGKVGRKTWKPYPPKLTVPIGPHDGSSIMFGWILGAWVTSIFIGKTLLQGRFRQIYGKAAFAPQPEA